MKQENSKVENSATLWLLVITLVALLIRLPYWEVIPASFDEVNQTSFAVPIAQGRSFPLVANDAYTGPFYVYLLAGLLRLGSANPMIGRVVIMIAGVLTVPIVYAWVRTLGNNRIAGLITALLVAINPDLILVNSHIGGSTFLLPFFTTLFLWWLALAWRRDSVGWLIASAIVAGLALQSNPVAGFVIMGGLLWFLRQTYRMAKLGKWWPVWPVGAGIIILLVYSPVIVYNLTTDFDTVGVLQERSYLWEDNPTVETTLNNIRRLSLQTSRQVSGVVRGEESLASLLGVPLLFVGLMALGLIYTTCYVSILPLLILVPFWLIFPVVSSHYGFISVGRFTTLLIPVWTAVIGFLLAESINKIGRMSIQRRRIYTGAIFSLGLLLLIYPVVSLFQYYDSVNAAHQSGRGLLALSRYAVAENQGEGVYMSSIDELSFLTGVPYVPHATFLLNNIHHEFLPPSQIVSRLYEYPGPAFLLLSDGDADVVAQTAPLVERVAISANDEAGIRGYGLYWYEGKRPLPKPDFVLEKSDIPEGIAPAVTIGEGIRLLGCDQPEVAESEQSMSLHCYWEAIDAMPSQEYVGFVHMIQPDTVTLIAQDDHILGQERYPVSAWQAGEVIRESYTLSLPADASLDAYELWLGIYTWPEVTRLNVPENPDNVVILPPVEASE